MSFRQVERIVITNFSCNNFEHQGRAIDTMCLNTQCQEACSLCSRCMLKGHQKCRDQECELELIPNMLMELRELQLDLEVLQELINNRFKDFISQIEQILLPISIYQESPNLTNLNQIGSLLRQDPRKIIIQSFNETKIQIKQLLENQIIINENSKQRIFKAQVPQQSNPQNSYEQMQISQEWFDKGYSLFEQSKYKEAIDCFDKAIELDPKHIDSWHYKGYSLYQQSKDKEAIDFFDKAIELDPKHHVSWYYKGYSLYQQSQYKEASQCYEGALKYFPNDTIFINKIKEWRQMR